MLLIKFDKAEFADKYYKPSMRIEYVLQKHNHYEIDEEFNYNHLIDKT